MNARSSLLERESEIIRLLNLFLDKKINFIVVGGYAIATYKKRFSVDLDLVIKEEDLEKFDKICKKEKYSLSNSKEIESLYGEQFKRYTKKINGLNVSIDFLINGLISRSTDAEWSFDYIKNNSSEKGLDSLRFLIPEKELLIAMKLHSGRLSDVRDVVALMPCNEEKVKIHVSRGNMNSLKESLKKQKEFLKKSQFDDSFKGIFGINSYNEKYTEYTERIMENLMKQ